MRRVLSWAMSLFSILIMSDVLSAADEKPKPPAYLEAAAAGPDFAVQGEYEPKLRTAGQAPKPGVQVIALGDGKFDAVVYLEGLPGLGTDWKNQAAMSGETASGATRFSGEQYSAELTNDGLTLRPRSGSPVELKKVQRESPSSGAKPPAGAIVLFDGNNVDLWTGGKLEEQKLLGVGERTQQKFKDYSLHLEFRTPFMPTARGQGRGNSGMYLNDQYECQILDSFGLKGENNECGGIYQTARPLVNMCFPPLSWQAYDVEFTAARFDGAGNKTAPAVLTMRQNGVLIHDHLELPKNTPGGGESDESKPGSIFLQDHGNPVRFRNIWIVVKE